MGRNLPEKRKVSPWDKVRARRKANSSSPSPKANPRRTELKAASPSGGPRRGPAKATASKGSNAGTGGRVMRMGPAPAKPARGGKKAPQAAMGKKTKKAWSPFTSERLGR